MNKSFFNIATIAILTTLLGACSSGGGETGTGYTEQTTVGVITGFGSVYINGIRYKTESAAVFVDDETSSEASLKVGMLVTLEGGVDPISKQGIASAIHFDQDIEGEVIENTFLTNNALNVLGQTVLIDNETIFESEIAKITSFALINPRNIVEVSGFSDGSGKIFATRIEVKAEAPADGTEMEIKGEVSYLSNNSFALGNMTVNYTNANFTNFQKTDLANGQLVKVKSTLGLQDNVLQASEIKLKEKLVAKKQVQEREEVELEGVVTLVAGNDTLFINGQKVLINSNTEIENIIISSVKIGDRIIVEGRLDAGGNIIAEELKGKKQSSTQIEGLITALNSSSSSISVNGIDIVIANTTRVKDDANESDDDERRYFNFADLGVGDKVHISFYIDSVTGSNIATKLEREKKELEGDTSNGEGDEDSGPSDEIDPNDSDNNEGVDDNESDSDNDLFEWETKGVVSQLNIDTQTFVIDGIVINYSRTTLPENIENGTDVEIHGFIDNGIWYAKSIEVKHDD